MTKPMARDPIYRQRAFDADIIQLCVRWYVTYRLWSNARQMMRRDRKPGSIDCPGLSAFNPSDGFQLGLDFLRLVRLGLRAIG